MSRASAWAVRHRTVTVLVVAVLATLAALSALSARTDVRAADLDPQNPSPNGAQALARVLAAHGVQVDVVRRAAELDRSGVDPDTTVLVTSSQNLGRSTTRRLRAGTAAAGALVLAAPDPAVVQTLGLPLVTDAARVGARSRARCDDPLLGGLTLEVPSTWGYRSAAGRGATACFPGRGAHPASLVVRVDDVARQGAATYAVGGAALFTNGQVDRADNAAAALRLLGQHDRLVWYVADPRDVRPGDAGSLAAQLPRGLVPGLWLAATAVLATMLWRGRRLGPLVVEPLPVAVKAVESTRGRGRLYRRVRDHAHAATVLRAATARRLTGQLRLPPGADPHELASAVARATGADPGEVYDALAGRPVTDDATLTRLAGELAALEREVHRA